MLGLKRLTVAQYERALVYRERSLERVLVPPVSIDCGIRVRA